MSAISPEEAVAKSQMLHQLRRVEVKKAHDSTVVARAQDRQSRTAREKAEKADRIEKAVKAQRKLEKKFKGVAVSYGKFALLEESSDDDARHADPKISSETEEFPTRSVTTPKKTSAPKKSRSKSGTKSSADQKKRSPYSPALVYFAVGVALGLGGLAARHWLGL